MFSSRPPIDPPTPSSLPQVLALHVSGATQVSALKTQLWEETGLKATDQYLLYQSKPLRDQATLALYGLGGCEGKPLAQHPPTVTLCVRQRGGCFIISLTILTVGDQAPSSLLLGRDPCMAACRWSD